jgi:hypothetical protein
MSIKGFRLVTGEVILAQEVSRGDCYTEVKSAAQLVTTEIEPGRHGVALQPFVPFAKGNIKILDYSVNAEFEIDQQVENEYNRIFGSGIQIVGADALAKI